MVATDTTESRVTTAGTTSSVGPPATSFTERRRTTPSMGRMAQTEEWEPGFTAETATTTTSTGRTETTTWTVGRGIVTSAQAGTTAITSTPHRARTGLKARAKGSG